MRAPNARGLERRRVYLGEGLTVRLRSAGSSEEASGEVVDMTPEGLGIAILAGPLELCEGGEITIEHTGRALIGLEQRAIVTNVTPESFGGRAMRRVGVSLVTEKTTRSARDRRRVRRFRCSNEFPALVTAQSPLFFNEWLHFRVCDISAGGMTASTSLRNKGLLGGMELSFRVNFNMIGVFEVRGRVTSIDRETNDGFRIGVAWIEPPRPLLNAASEYLLIIDKRLTPTLLREAGLPTQRIELAVAYDYARMPDEYEEILALRLRARRHEEGHDSLTVQDMASPFDKYARHVVCRFGGRLIIAGRVTYVGHDASRSEYVTMGGHELPDWLWEEGFVEVGAGQTDPDFQRSGLYISFAQHCIRVALQSGYRYLVLGCNDGLVEVFRDIGGVTVDTREAEPRPGWKFRSHVMYIDLEGLVTNPPEGKFVNAMSAAAVFATGMRRSSEAITLANTPSTTRRETRDGNPQPPSSGQTSLSRGASRR